jgi:hypothetical protein
MTDYELYAEESAFYLCAERDDEERDFLESLDLEGTVCIA